MDRICFELIFLFLSSCLITEPKVSFPQIESSETLSPRVVSAEARFRPTPDGIEFTPKKIIIYGLIFNGK